MGKMRVVRSAAGQKLFADKKSEIVIDYSPLRADEVGSIGINAGISAGAVLSTRIEPNPYIGGARVFITFDLKMLMWLNYVYSSNRMKNRSA